jgi:hypothetical protein
MMVGYGVAASTTNIENETQLQNAINAIQPRIDMNVTLCNDKRIKLSPPWMPNKQMPGINISNEFIHERCSNPQNPLRCQIDGSFKSHIFYGTSCSLS